MSKYKYHPKSCEAMEKFGIDPNRVVVESVDETGYSAFVFRDDVDNGSKVRIIDYSNGFVKTEETWPEGAWEYLEPIFHNEGVYLRPGEFS